ncbi:NAD-P-binding protein [Panus rudis PR-1116 ss-1]|nr:NAD-P-binding protein [Panus rudis PR-1116 ss-1]
MHLLVLGGTGPSGLLLIRQALDAGHTVVIYARSPKKLPDDITSNPSVTLVEGQLTDEDALSRAMNGVHAIVSALGPPVSQGITYPRNTPLAHAYSLVIEAMRRHDVKRIVLLGTPSMKDEHDKFSFQFAALVSGVALFAHNAYRDVVAIGELFKQNTDLVWTIARVPILTSDTKTDHVAGYVGDGKTRTTLSRAAFAAFVIGELEKNEWCRKAPLISSP